MLFLNGGGKHSAGCTKLLPCHNRLWKIDGMNKKEKSLEKTIVSLVCDKWEETGENIPGNWCARWREMLNYENSTQNNWQWGCRTQKRENSLLKNKKI